MDGNGRWATSLHRPRSEGHRQGSESVRAAVRACRKLGIESLTLFAFSAQNWLRPADEVRALMALLQEFLRTERKELVTRGIRFRSIGRVQQLPQPIQALVSEVAEETQACKGMTLTLALSYGGREEIVDAAKSLAERVQQGELKLEDVDEQHLEAALPSMQVGPVDLLVRTGGEERISNFLLWGAAYAELFFTNKLWPEFRENDVFEAIAAYQQRERRFGQVIFPSEKTEVSWI